MSGSIYLLFVSGLLLLIIGAEALVRGASKLAAALGVAPLIVGLTVVAYGTSSPEMAVSVHSSLMDQPNLALGNVVGSNIFNVLFILGVSAAIAPLTVSSQLVRLDVPIMIGASVLTWVLALDGRIGRLDGVFLFLCILAYTYALIHIELTTRQQSNDRPESTEVRESSSPWRIGCNLALIALGLVLLVIGSRWLVQGAVSMAQAFNNSELVIGLTVVAAGTSLPELATSVVASLRGERDIAVGNVVGSNIFNILAVLGLSSAVAVSGIEVSAAAERFDIPVMTAVSVACLPIFFTGSRISQWEGLCFFVYYIIYSCYLILNSMHHQMLPLFSRTMLGFVIPITVLTLLIVSWRTFKAR
ncbi:calcium/sodium antiporter [Desulfoferrobacter suflitae]|uniref:calcium/sodium antiporter n=1 Tax=Desulfoferrobacter suflitae TaxID=2865782 RepID=UPI00216448E5|nr:calcium/sodium antiporter [Desulfoferrobacter suflitae]MCK8603647.1 calcium/sodium antiporter [Desulfoferrobacter suflitae]